MIGTVLIDFGFNLEFEIDFSYIRVTSSQLRFPSHVGESRVMMSLIFLKQQASPMVLLARIEDCLGFDNLTP